MRHMLTLAIASVLTGAVYAQGGIPYPAGSQSFMPEQTIELKDGTRLIHNGNGVMLHVDQKGRRLVTAGRVEAADGSVYAMRDGWAQRLLVRGTRPHTP